MRREVRETRDEGTSSRTSADHVRLRAAEADQVQSDRPSQITEETKNIDEEVNKQFPYYSKFRSELRKRHDTISR